MKNIFLNNFFQEIIRQYLRRRGYSKWVIGYLPEVILKDLFTNKEFSFRNRLWAVRRGFYVNRIPLYHLDEQNYRDYLSEYKYVWLHPINGAYNPWLEDKVSYKLLLRPFSEYLPEYYYHVTPQGLLRLPDCPEEYEMNFNGLINLLRSRGALAAKLVFGAAGRGFHKLQYTKGDYLVDNQPSTELEIRKLIEDWKLNRVEYIITEYLSPHSDLGRIWPETPNALRITTIKGTDHITRIAYAFTRFGTSKTGAVDNTAAGGIINLIELETGFFTHGMKFQGDELVDCIYHPDTGILIEGTVPHWTLIKEKILEICDYLEQLRFIGFDIAVVDNGFKIIELNYLPSLECIQYFSPVFKDDVMKPFFEDLIAEKKIQLTNLDDGRLMRKIRASLSSIKHKLIKLSNFRGNKSPSMMSGEIVALIQNSGLFDEHYYLDHYPDVRQSGFDPLQHYFTIGGFAGYNPGPGFDSAFYLELYEDVKRERMNPLVHYLKYGRYEGRTPTPET